MNLYYNLIIQYTCKLFLSVSECPLWFSRLPLEAHIMFFKNLYVSQDEAMKKIDGTVTIAYFFKVE